MKNEVKNVIHTPACAVHEIFIEPSSITPISTFSFSMAILEILSTEVALQGRLGSPWHSTLS